jgi:hypothetical protein
MPKQYAEGLKHCWKHSPGSPCATCWYFMAAGGHREPLFSPPDLGRMITGPPHVLGSESMSSSHKNFHLLHPCEKTEALAATARERTGAHAMHIGASEAALAVAANLSVVPSSSAATTSSTRSSRRRSAATPTVSPAQKRQAVPPTHFAPPSDGFRDKADGARHDPVDASTPSAATAAATTASAAVRGPATELGGDDHTPSSMGDAAARLVREGNGSAANTPSGAGVPVLGDYDAVGMDDFADFPWVMGQSPPRGLTSIGTQIGLAEEILSLKRGTATMYIHSCGDWIMERALERLHLTGDSGVNSLQQFRTAVNGPSRGLVTTAIESLRATLQLSPAQSLLHEVHWLYHRHEVENTPGAVSTVQEAEYVLERICDRSRGQNFREKLRGQLSALAAPTTIDFDQVIKQFKGKRGMGRSSTFEKDKELSRAFIMNTIQVMCPAAGNELLAEMTMMCCFAIAMLRRSGTRPITC